MQMTKRDALPLWTGRNHVAYLDLSVGHDHTVNQQLDQGSLLLKGRLLQSLLHPLTKLNHTSGEVRKFCLAIHLTLQFLLLALQYLVALFHLTTTALILFQRYHSSEVGLSQALNLCRQTDPPPSNTLPSCLISWGTHWPE